MCKINSVLYFIITTKEKPKEKKGEGKRRKEGKRNSEIRHSRERDRNRR